MIRHRDRRSPTRISSRTVSGAASSFKPTRRLNRARSGQYVTRWPYVRHWAIATVAPGERAGSRCRNSSTRRVFPASGGRDEAHEKWASVGEGPPGDGLELRQVVVAPDQRKAGRRGLGRPPEEGQRLDRQPLSFHIDLGRAPQGEPDPSSPGCPLAAQDGPRLGRLLQARGNVHRVARDQEVACRVVARGDHLGRL